jgi:hypothetical protein
MGDDVNESSDSSSSSALSTSSTSSSDEETDSEQNTTTKHVTSQEVYDDNQGEDNGNSDDGTSTKVDGSVALDSIIADVNDATPSDSETLQIQESSRYCRLPLQRNTVPSRLAQLIYLGIFTSFQQHGALLDKNKSLAKNILLQMCEDSYTESLCCDSAFTHKKEISIFKFPERFSEISWTESSLYLLYSLFS